MPRTIAAELITALNSDDRRPYVALELDLDVTPIRIWSGFGERTINGDIYLPAGDALSLGGVDETDDLSSTSMSATLKCTRELITLALGGDENWANRPIKAMLGDVSVASVFTYFEGLIDALPISDDPNGPRQISGLFENKLVELDDAPNFKYTQAAHQAVHPGDTFFNFVNDIIDKEIPWGRETSSSGSVQSETPVTENVPTTDR